MMIRTGSGSDFGSRIRIRKGRVGTPDSEIDHRTRRADELILQVRLVQKPPRLMLVQRHCL
jgi:hypothetical protein